MPAHRKPVELLELAGTFRDNPKRRRAIGPKSDRELGRPPAYLSSAEKAVWTEIASIVPAGLLTSGDRIAVELLARLVSKMRLDWLNGSELGILTGLLARMGMSPADRSRVSAAPPKDASDAEWDQFVN